MQTIISIRTMLYAGTYLLVCVIIFNNESFENLLTRIKNRYLSES